MRQISLVSLASLTILTGAGYAFAADTDAGTAGRPTAVLSHDACLAIWHGSAGDELARFHVGQHGLTPVGAKGIVTNFQQADVDNDGSISQAEFVDACRLGLVTGPVLGLHSGS
jgi:hypothetical protein